MNETATKDSVTNASTSLMTRSGAVLEFIAVCFLSVAIAFVYLNLLNGPNLTLLFDGFGFLTITQGFVTTFNADVFHQVLSYCLSGFDENIRRSLLEKLAPANGIVRSGPLLPLTLSLTYFVAGKPPAPQFWAVGTWAMWLTQALMIGLIWLSARLAFNSTVARVAAVMALSYAPFIVNGNRLATETQACFAIILATALFLFYGRNQFKHTKTMRSGAVAGIVLGLLALARPPFLLLPVLLVVAMFFAARGIKVGFPFAGRWLIGVICGAGIILGPWALCNQILTGKPSIAVDRFGIYNLYAGLNTKTLGLDTFPGEYVEHPGRFNTPLMGALKQVIDYAVADPARCLAMLALKPVRLLDSPWNDCQAICFGLPWLLQRYFHQLVLLFAFSGIFSLWRKAMTEKNWSSLVPAIMLTLVVLYNFIHCLFISMGRYTYPIMPEILILSAWGAYSFWSVGKKRWGLLGLSLFVPLTSFLVECLSAPPFPLIPTLAIAIGPDLLAASIGLLVFAGLPLLTWVFATLANFERRTVYATMVLSTLCSFFALFATWYGVRQAVEPHECGGKSKKSRLIVPVPDSIGHGASSGHGTSSWFVVIDPWFDGYSLDVLKSVRCAVNGVEVKSELLPLLALDSDQRSNAVYERAFTHSGRKDITSVRQWYCLAVPSNLVKGGADNVIDIWRGADGPETRLFIMCDLMEQGKDVAPVAFRQFSWTKGFTINPPLDMRMPDDNKEGSSNKLGEPAPEAGKIHPRLYLLEVEPDDRMINKDERRVSDVARIYVNPGGEADVIKLADARIGPGKMEKVVIQSIPSEKLPHLIDGIKSGAGNAVRLKVSGEIVAEDGKGNASLALITNLSSRDSSGNTFASESMAPLAPELLPAEMNGRSFSFVDIVPAFTDSDGKPVRLAAARPPGDLGHATAQPLPPGALNHSGLTDLQALETRKSKKSTPGALNPGGLSPVTATSSCPYLSDFSARVRVLAAGKSWWDVLQYANYKVEKPVTVRALTIEAAPANLPDLTGQSWHLFRCRPWRSQPR